MPRHQDPWTDEQILTALDLRDNELLTGAKIAARMGRSRAAVIGVCHRIDMAQEPGAEHRNGTLPRRWWERRTT